MKLGEKIYKLRNQHKMSQEDLAQKLSVSRQSISKWENNTSVPELEKLIQLSEVFQITLDELVKGECIPCEAVHKMTDTEPTGTIVVEMKEEKTKEKSNTDSPMSTQRIIGFILLTIGLLSLILAFVLSRGLAVLGGYLILCGILCLLLKKYVGLVIGWITFILSALITIPFTAVRMLGVLNPLNWGKWWTVADIFSVFMWIALALLLFFSYYAILKNRR